MDGSTATTSSPIRMATRILHRSPWALILILFVASVPVGKADEDALLNPTTPKLPQLDFMDNSRNAPENVSTGTPNEKTTQLQGTHHENSSKVNETSVNTDMPASESNPENGTQNITSVNSTKDNSPTASPNMDITKNVSDQNESPEKKENSTINDTNAVVKTDNAMTSTLDGVTNTTIKPTIGLYDGTTKRFLTTSTEVLLTNSKDQFSHNEVNPITSTTQATTGKEMIYTTTAPSLNKDTTSPPPPYKFVLRPNIHGEPCIVATMRIQLDIQFKQHGKLAKVFKANVPKNFNVSGSCDKPHMAISWLDELNNDFVLTLKTSLRLPWNESMRKDKSISVTEVLLKMKFNSKDFPGDITSGETILAQASNLSLFKSTVNQLYSSSQVQLKLTTNSSKVGPTTLNFTDVQFKIHSDGIMASKSTAADDSALENTSNSNKKAFYICGGVALFGIAVFISVFIYRKMHRGTLRIRN